MKPNKDKCEVAAVSENNATEFENGQEQTHVGAATFVGGRHEICQPDHRHTKSLSRIAACVPVLKSLDLH